MIARRKLFFGSFGPSTLTVVPCSLSNFKFASRKFESIKEDKITPQLKVLSIIRVKNAFYF